MNEPLPTSTFADRLTKLFWRRPAEALAERTRRRVVVHLIPFLFCLYILAYLDRANVAVAALSMQKPVEKGGLGFIETITGFGFGIFFWGYWILEIPSTLSVLKWGARYVFVRILILWGCSCMFIGVIGSPVGDSIFGWLGGPLGDGIFQALGWVARLLGRDTGPLQDLSVRQFYFLRFMLGFFEGGFFPSVILYLTMWFPARDQAKAIATFMAAIPFSSAIGNPISGAILQVHWFDLDGWRWIFLLQGGLPIVAGFVTLFFLPDRPETARWLRPEERDCLVKELHEEHLSKKAHGHWVWLSQAGTVLLLTGYYFCMNVTSYGLVAFMPQIIKAQSGFGSTAASFLAAVPYLMGLIGMLINGAHSDRTQERIGHVAVPLLCLSLGIFVTALLDGLTFWPVLAMIFLVGTFMYAHLPAFWPLPSTFLGAAAAASAIGFINMIGNLGGSLGPMLAGEAAKGQKSFAPLLYRMAPFPLFSVVLILAVGWLSRHALAKKG